MVCHECGQEMLEVFHCKLDKYIFSDGARERIPYGSERPRWRGATCGDCGVRRGEFHHPGCDIERCPRCEEQAISCDCPYDARELGLVDVPTAIDRTARFMWEGFAEDERHDPLFIDAISYCGHLGFSPGAVLTMPRDGNLDPALLFDFGVGSTTAALLFICRAASPFRIGEADLDIVGRLHSYALSHDVRPWELVYVTTAGNFKASDLLGLPGLPGWRDCPLASVLNDASARTSLT